jgi:DNA-binding NarL/FixJ family response regulator
LLKAAGARIGLVSENAQHKIEIMIVANHPILRLALRDLVHREPDMELLCEAKCEGEARIRYLACHPDVTVVDLDLPGGGGWKAVRSILAIDPRAPIIGLTTCERTSVPTDIEHTGLVLISKSVPSGDIVWATRLAASRPA